MIRILKTGNIPSLLCRLAVGLIFLSEGMQKFLYPDATGAGRFAKIGFSNPSFWAHFTGTFEIICGILILTGFLTRLAAIPLLIIMIVAFITTKYPILIDKGFWSMAHEYRTDFAMTMLLIHLLMYGAATIQQTKKSLILKRCEMKPGTHQHNETLQNQGRNFVRTGLMLTYQEQRFKSAGVVIQNDQSSKIVPVIKGGKIIRSTVWQSIRLTMV